MSKELLNPEKALIFRIVHKDNVGKVLQAGCQCRSSAGEQTAYVEIGNQELIQRRTLRIVPCAPGGTLSDYVPFYFTPYSPMLYNIKTGFGVPQKPLKDIVLLVSSLRRMEEMRIPFVFSDRHAYLKTAQFSNDLADLNRIIWPVLQVRDFKRDDLDKFEKYQAEALVHQHVPVSALIGIACYDDESRDHVMHLAADCGATVKIVTQRSWFL
jgi:ssDNA thymidine ADP-ribosyltransferase, DarT